MFTHSRLVFRLSSFETSTSIHVSGWTDSLHSSYTNIMLSKQELHMAETIFRHYNTEGFTKPISFRPLNIGNNLERALAKVQSSDIESNELDTDFYSQIPNLDEYQLEAVLALFNALWETEHAKCLVAYVSTTKAINRPKLEMNSRASHGHVSGPVTTTSAINRTQPKMNSRASHGHVSGLRYSVEECSEEEDSDHGDGSVYLVINDKFAYCHNCNVVFHREVLFSAWESCSHFQYGNHRSNSQEQVNASWKTQPKLVSKAVVRGMLVEAFQYLPRGER